MRSYWLAGLVLASGCDEKKATPTTEPSASAVASVALAPPPVAKPPFLSVDEKACYVGGDKVDLAAGDAKARVAAILGTKPKVEGEMLELQALRDVKFPKVAALLDGARTAKAKGVTIKTSRRDQSMGEIEVRFDHAPLAACSAIASIGKDSGVNVWPAGGGTADHFTHGMAGPDMTRGVAGAQKVAGACAESYVWAVTAEDTVQWGLVFDLATLAMGAFDGGKPMRATQLDVLADAVPGRKVL
jgi:hypothetical protein